jgi:hypothetical protein
LRSVGEWPVWTLTWDLRTGQGAILGDQPVFDITGPGAISGISNPDVNAEGDVLSAIQLHPADDKPVTLPTTAGLTSNAVAMNDTATVVVGYLHKGPTTRPAVWTCR